MKRNEHDITDLLFPLGEQTPEDKRKLELWNLATSKAYELTGSVSPILLLSKTNEFYKNYLHAENLPYDEVRGF